jgi:hypothetical protein
MAQPRSAEKHSAHGQWMPGALRSSECGEDLGAGLVEWASESKAAGLLLPLPEGFEQLKFNPFRTVAA